jgi:hypothetical protein
VTRKMSLSLSVRILRRDLRSKNLVKIMSNRATSLICFCWLCKYIYDSRFIKDHNGHNSSDFLAQLMPDLQTEHPRCRGSSRDELACGNDTGSRQSLAVNGAIPVSVTSCLCVFRLYGVVIYRHTAWRLLKKGLYKIAARPPCLFSRRSQDLHCHIPFFLPSSSTAAIPPGSTLSRSLPRSGRGLREIEPRSEFEPDSHASNTSNPDRKAAWLMIEHSSS